MSHKKPSKPLQAPGCLAPDTKTVSSPVPTPFPTQEAILSYSELVKNLNPIRHYVRDFFVCGFKSRGDFSEKSARSYDDQRRRIDSWLAPYMCFHQSDGKKCSFLSVAAREEAENPLFRVFCAKSFTAMDLKLHFFLSDILAGGEALTTSVLWERLIDGYPVEDEAGNLPDESTVRKKCAEYAALGVFRKEKAGRQVTYALAPALSLSGAADALAWAEEIFPAGVLGYFLRQKAGAPTLPLFLKHHYLFRALDAEVACTLLTAMREGRFVDVRFQNKKETVSIYPARLFVSTQTGREYLFYIAGKTPQFSRLDHMDEVRLGDVAPDADAREEAARAELSHCWGISSKQGARLYHVKLGIRVARNEEFIVRRLRREKRCGIVRRESPGHWVYEADVFDPLEMLPWLRTFIGRIEKLETDHPYLVKRFRKDFRDLCALYDDEEGGAR